MPSSTFGANVISDASVAGKTDDRLLQDDVVAAGTRAFDLIETMRFDPHGGILDLDRHLSRMQQSAAAFGVRFDRQDALDRLLAATSALDEGRRVRLLLSPSGAIAIHNSAIPPASISPVAVALAPLPVDPSDVRLRHKTTDRAFYDQARITVGTFEVIFEDRGFLTEGSFTNIFVPRGDRMLTPPLWRGLLPGILRQRLIEERVAEEGDLRRGDLAGEFFVGNALRGLIPARLVPAAR